VRLKDKKTEKKEITQSIDERERELNYCIYYIIYIFAIPLFVYHPMTVCSSITSSPLHSCQNLRAVTTVTAAVAVDVEKLG
jgi:hypothetical protein